MAKPKRPEEDPLEAKSIKAPKSLWDEFDSLVGSYRRSTVLQELMEGYVRQKKAEQAGEELEELKERLARLENPDT